MNPTASSTAALRNPHVSPANGQPSIVLLPRPGPVPHVRTGASYRTRLAATSDDVIAAQQRRFEVFNVELQEGLKENWKTRLDVDRFDASCDHLLVEHASSGRIVGTYRLQTGRIAAEGNGYYSAQEFDFTPYEPIRDELVELGRACVHQDHRKMNVLNLLWRGIADYARDR